MKINEQMLLATKYGMTDYWNHIPANVQARFGISFLFSMHLPNIGEQLVSLFDPTPEGATTRAAWQKNSTFSLRNRINNNPVSLRLEEELGCFPWD